MITTEKYSKIHGIILLVGSSPDALGTLSDLLGDFLSKLSKLLRINADCQSGAKGCLGFQDALERSLHQVGMEGKSGLYQYWQTSVQGHARRLEMEADEYRNSYLTLTVGRFHISCLV